MVQGPCYVPLFTCKSIAHLSGSESLMATDSPEYLRVRHSVDLRLDCSYPKQTQPQPRVWKQQTLIYVSLVIRRAIIDDLVLIPLWYIWYSQ